MKTIVIIVLVIYNAHTSNVGYFGTMSECWQEAKRVRAEKPIRGEDPLRWRADCISMRVDLETLPGVPGSEK